MQKRKKIEKFAMIGEQVQINGLKNTELNELDGKIIDETRNTITIETKQSAKTIIKDQIIIKTVQGKTIDGRNLVGRVEERIKK